MTKRRETIMNIGIVTAMEAEREQVDSLLSEKEALSEGPFRFTKGMIGYNRVILMQCGIGKVNAAVGIVELIRRFQPDCLISTGVAGGIDTRLNVMDVVASRQVVYHDVWCGEGNEYGQVQNFPARFEGNETLMDCALKLKTDMKIYDGLICSGDQFITAGERLKQIKRRFPEGLAVDMESGAIAQVCYLYAVPFISFRTVSDTPEAENSWQQYTDFWKTIADRSFSVTRAFLNALPQTLSLNSI